MTTVTPLPNGGQCIQVTMRDQENEVRIHLHDETYGPDDAVQLVGLTVTSAKLGLLYEEGRVVAPECATS